MVFKLCYGGSDLVLSLILNTLVLGYCFYQLLEFEWKAKNMYQSCLIWWDLNSYFSLLCGIQLLKPLSALSTLNCCHPPELLVSCLTQTPFKVWSIWREFICQVYMKYLKGASTSVVLFLWGFPHFSVSSHSASPHSILLYTRLIKLCLSAWLHLSLEKLEISCGRKNIQ